MPYVIVNGTKHPIRYVDVELSRLKLDPENPRLHSSYLTHKLPPKPTQVQLQEALAALPEFQDLVDAIARNDGCFLPPLVASDLRVLEGNRRVAALRTLRQAGEGPKWARITAQQFVERLGPSQEQAVRAKFHLESQLAWDELSLLAEYLAVAEREGADVLAQVLGRFRKQIEPLLVAGRCVRRYSELHSDHQSADELRALAGLCGIKQIAPKLALSKITCTLFCDEDEQRPACQPYTVAQIFTWLSDGRFTRPHTDEDGNTVTIRPDKAAALFKRVRSAGEEHLAYFLESEGSLAKAVCSLDGRHASRHRREHRALMATRKYVDLLNQMKGIRRDESPELYRDTMACYNRLGVLLAVAGKDARRAAAARS